MYNNQNNYNQGYSGQPEYATQGYQNQQYANQQHGSNQVAEEVPKKSKVNLILVILILMLIILLALFGISFMNKKEHYAVVFVNGENIEALVVEEGEKFSEKVVTTTGFIGWYEGDTKYDFSKKVTANVILKARYDNIDESVKTYKVTFDTDGGSTISNQNIKENEKVTKPSNPTKGGYDFVEWQLNGKTYDFNTPIVQDLTLKAQWKRNSDKITYTVIFDTDGGSTISNQTVKEKGKVSKPSNPTKTGYTFKEWQLNGKTYDFSKIVTENITLKAVWEVKEKVTIKFDSNGGSTVNAISVYTGDKIGTLKTPTKEEYKFDGWYDGTTRYTSSTVVKKAVTLKAKWITEEAYLLSKAKASIKSSYTIEKGGTEIKPTYTGCTITHLTQNDIAKITRNVSDTKITLKFEVQCKELKETVTSVGVIKASPYKYVAAANSNMQNYDLTVKSGSLILSKNGIIYNMSGSYLSDLNDGKAVINNDDISEYPNFKMTLSGDSKTIYVIKK